MICLCGFVWIIQKVQMEDNLKILPQFESFFLGPYFQEKIGIPGKFLYQALGGPKSTDINKFHS